jgi:putative membrane protein
LVARSLSRLTGLAAVLPLPAFAHAAGSGSRGGFEWWLVALLAASAALYAIGVRRLWQRAGRGRGITLAQSARFAAGWLALCAALLSPIDTLGAALFSVHMVQHELLMVVAAPLLVVSRPIEAWTWAVKPAWRKALAGVVRFEPLSAAWRICTEPIGAWSLHAVALWAWHVPALFEAALADEAVHVAQHSCFLVSALFFWWSVVARGARRGGASVAGVFTTMMHTSALGALLTFAPTPWYAHYAETSAFGLSALEDQQLGGLIMWVPGGLAYLVAGLAIVAAWLGEPRARTETLQKLRSIVEQAPVAEAPSRRNRPRGNAAP